MRMVASSTLILILAAGTAGAQDQCKHQADRSATVEIGSARLLDLTAGSGSLRVEGKPGLTHVVLRGKACASDASLLDGIGLETERGGNAITVRANVRDRNDRQDWRNNQYARLDLVVEVPAGFAADIEDGSGEVALYNLGAVELRDGSGSIKADRLAAIRIADGSGEIRLTDINGSVTIRDGSGSIHLHNIGGAIDIDDGSGEVRIRNARSNVRISDGSGGIDVSDIAGDFTVENDGSGGIEYENVRGKVNVPRNKRR